METTQIAGVALTVLIALAGPAQPTNKVNYDPDIIRSNLVDIGGGRRLNLNCVGQGSPTVIFEQGGEGNILNWRKVQPAITAITRTCFYDRAGFGFSDPPDKPVTVVNVTDDLHKLLQIAGIGGPIVLVGHSIGGLYATVYADRFPSEVSGLVLIDPAFAGQFDFGTPAQRASNLDHDVKAENESGWACVKLVEHEDFAAGVPGLCQVFPKGETPAEAVYLQRPVMTGSWYRAEMSQSESLFRPNSEDTREETAVRRTFGDKPVIVLTSEKIAFDDWQDEAMRKAFSQHWRAGHDALAARSARGESIVVGGSDHFIQRSAPAAVIQAVEKVVVEVRSSQSSR